MIGAWRKLPVHDAICCDEARKAAGAYCEQLSQHPESLSQIMKNILEELPSTSCTPLIIRKNKRSEISVSIQTLVTVISSRFKLLMSSPEIHLIEISFRKINFGLVQLLEDGASEA
jgi:hypothetical protein